MLKQCFVPMKVFVVQDKGNSLHMKFQTSFPIYGMIFPITQRVVVSRTVVLNLWGVKNGGVAKWGRTGRTEEPLLQNLAHHIQILTYFTSYNHLQTVIITKRTNIWGIVSHILGKSDNTFVFCDVTMMLLQFNRPQFESYARPNFSQCLFLATVFWRLYVVAVLGSP